eukprot:3816598-Amphidinium_carterae.1
MGKLSGSKFQSPPSRMGRLPRLATEPITSSKISRFSSLAFWTTSKLLLLCSLRGSGKWWGGEKTSQKALCLAD